MRVSTKAIAAILGTLVALAVIAGAVVWLSPVFQVSQYSIRGAEHIEQSRVEEATGVRVGDNLVRVDARDAAAGVAKIPWVKSATVRRDFPSTLVVEVTEREAVAFRESADGPHLIDANGEEFIIDTPPEQAVKITGDVKADSPEMADAVEVASAVDADIRAQVDHLEVKGPYSFVFYLKDQRTVEWGANEDNANKALAFATVLGQEGKDWNISNPQLVSRR